MSVKKKLHHTGLLRCCRGGKNFKVESRTLSESRHVNICNQLTWRVKGRGTNTAEENGDVEILFQESGFNISPRTDLWDFEAFLNKRPGSFSPLLGNYK